MLRSLIISSTALTLAGAEARRRGARSDLAGTSSGDWNWSESSSTFSCVPAVLIQLGLALLLGQLEIGEGLKWPGASSTSCSEKDVERGILREDDEQSRARPPLSASSRSPWSGGRGGCGLLGGGDSPSLLS
eukprot:scaffold185442_cov27-Tisochrysis_lutea.AAC.1